MCVNKVKVSILSPPDRVRNKQGRTLSCEDTKMYGPGEIVATVNDYLFTIWAVVIKCGGGSIINSAAR